MLIAYAKGARTFERHVDIESDGVKVSPYCSLPDQVDQWFKTFHKAKAMCGAPGTQKRLPPRKEIEYLDALVRGVYAKADLPEGHILSDEDVYLAVPLQKGQISCRELMRGEVLLKPIRKDEPIQIDAIDSPYSSIASLKAAIYARGIEPAAPETKAKGQGTGSSERAALASESAMKTISIITPCYNEELNVREVYERVRAAIASLRQLSLRAHLHRQRLRGQYGGCAEGDCGRGQECQGDPQHAQLRPYPLAHARLASGDGRCRHRHRRRPAGPAGDDRGHGARTGKPDRRS